MRASRRTKSQVTRAQYAKLVERGEAASRRIDDRQAREAYNAKRRADRARAKSQAKIRQQAAELRRAHPNLRSGPATLRPSYTIEQAPVSKSQARRLKAQQEAKYGLDRELTEADFARARLVKGGQRSMPRAAQGLDPAQVAKGFHGALGIDHPGKPQLAGLIAGNLTHHDLSGLTVGVLVELARAAGVEIRITLDPRG